MKFLFYLGHPAHFHLFKNVLKGLSEKGHAVSILIKTKDVLEELLKQSAFKYCNILPQGRRNGPVGIAWGLAKRIIKMLVYCKTHRPDLLIGTSVEISLIGKILGIPSVNVNEDDADVVPLYAALGYPLASTILTPTSCHSGKWQKKAIRYEGLHELAYLHPKHFRPDRKIVRQYFPTGCPYFILRFAKLTAHHDNGIQGLSTESAAGIIRLLKPHGEICISTERALEPEFERYRMQINPADIHHFIYFANMIIGDSQTMAAEAGVLGTPFIRCNDFVGRIGYLKEIEDKYQLGFGIKPSDTAGLYTKIKEMLDWPEARQVFDDRRRKLLSQKIDVSNFMLWFFEEYPQSVDTLRENSNYPSRFR